MPIYEFRCSTCGAKFEKRLSMSAANNPMDCPGCGGASKRLISACAAIRRSENGQVSSVSGGCTGCSGGNCSGCHH